MRPHINSEIADLTIVHPWDPWSQGIGGFDSFLDDFLRHTPPSLTLELICVTTDSRVRPVGHWQVASFSGHQVRFFAVLEDQEPDRVQLVPLSLRFAYACWRYKICTNGQIVQFHRFESSLGLTVSRHSRKVFFLHNHPDEIRSPHSDVRWHWLSQLHDHLLLHQLRQASTIVSVDPRTPGWIETHLPDLRRRVIYQREWADPTIFHDVNVETRNRERGELRNLLKAESQTKIVLFVGRLESQKDPVLLLEAFALLQRRQPRTFLTLVGKGRLERLIKSKARELGISTQVRLLGAISREEIPEIYRGADVLICTSGFEAGPLTVFESLACGTPVVSVDVGQVGKILNGQPEIGLLVEGRDPKDIAQALEQVLEWQPSLLRQKLCAEAVAAFTPQRGLAPVFDLYEDWLKEDKLQVTAN